MSGLSCVGADQIVLQVSANPVLNIAGAQLAGVGLPVVGVVPKGQLPPERGDHARWLEIDRRQPAARTIIDALLERTVVILGDNLEDETRGRTGLVRAMADPSISLISGIRAGLAMPGIGDIVTRSPAIDVLAGQALALRILNELRLLAHERDVEPIILDAEETAVELLTAAGGHQVTVPPAGRFATADWPIFLNAGNDAAFSALMHMLNRQDLLSDFRYKTEAARIHNGLALHSLLQPVLSAETSEVWLERLQRFQIPACRAPEPLTVAAPPVPLVSAEIVLELGFRAEQVAGWQQRGVIGLDQRTRTASTTAIAPIA